MERPIADPLDPKLHSLLEESQRIYLQHFDNSCSFERAIFISWYCSKADCKFCYMSTQKGKIKNVPLGLAKRRPESLITEALLCRELGWNIEFLSGGYDAYTSDELVDLIKKIAAAYGKKLWLNIGILTDSQMDRVQPYVEGICGSLETLNPVLHDEMCPSKPLGPLIGLLERARKKGFKTGITLIVGLGETIDDFALLESFAQTHPIDRVTFYRLNPHPGTPFTAGPSTAYYSEWIARTRIAFPHLEIIAGSWVDKIEEIHLLLRAGANHITKFPSTGLFNTSFARRIETEIQQAGRIFHGTLTVLPAKDWDAIARDLDPALFDEKLKKKILLKVQSYLDMMRSNAADS